jgi:cysteine sulfinate desulfinase/cysteine desulfurase-like protein
VLAAVRPDTLLVSVQQANNETGVRQPLGEIAAGLAGHHAYLHTDAAQGFGKESKPLRLHRVDLISASAHKLYAPKGVGCLVARRRGFDRPPLSPLLFGGGQERGLRPGTLPVHLVVGFGMACALAEKEGEKWNSACLAFRERLLGALLPLGARDERRCIEDDGSRHQPLVPGDRLGGADGSVEGDRGGVERLCLYISQLRTQPRAPSDGTFARQRPGGRTSIVVSPDRGA